MTRFTALHAATLAASLSLSLVAGCAAPLATVAPTAGPAAGQASPAAQPAAPSAPAPVVAPTAFTPTTLSGAASFRGEPLAGYAVTVLDARTGEPVPLTADLAGASGLAVLNQNLVTDAAGGFSLQVAGLSAGQALRVQVSKGEATLETIVSSDLNGLGAPAAYAVQAAGSKLVISELTTAIAHVARGVLLTTLLLPPQQAAPVLAKLATEMTSLSTKLAMVIKADPSQANAVVSRKDGDRAVKGLVSNANALQSLTVAIAALVSEIAKAAGPNPTTPLPPITFAGTVLTGGLVNGSFQLTNSVSGTAVDAASGNLGNVTTQVTSSVGGRQSTPAAPVIVGTPVATPEELVAALADESVTTIAMTADIDVSGLFDSETNYNPVTFSHAVTLNGYNHSLTGLSYLAVNVSNVTIKNLVLNQGVQTPYFGNTTGMTLDHVVFNTVGIDNAIVNSYYGSGHTIHACTFNGGDEAILFVSGTITDSTFNNPNRAVRYKEASTITGNTFNLGDEQTGVQFETSGWTTETLSGVHDNTFARTGTGASPYAFYFQQLVPSGGPALVEELSDNEYGTIELDYQVRYMESYPE